MSKQQRQSVIVADPKRDLILERVVAVPPALVWEAWTTPEHIKKWFTPAPWSTVECEIDLRPGGTFRTVMRSPEGQEFPNDGCYLEIIEGEKLVWTTALSPGYRPGLGASTPEEALLFTAVITIEPAGKDGGNTRYVATVIHGDEVSRNKHETMGFHDGWGAALDQLVALMQQR